VITRSLGPNPTVQIDLEGLFPIEAGDTFLLCSDGLTGKVEDAEMGPILATLPPDEAVQVLVDLASLRGGPDNITVVVAKVVAPEMTTRVAGMEPIKVGAETATRAVHPAVWGVAAAFFIAAVGMLALDNFIPAVVAALGAVVTLGVGLFQRYGGMKPGVALGADQRLGKGPHTRTECLAGGAFIAKLENIVRQMREAGEEEHWAVNWPAFEEHCNTAAAAANSKQFSQAVREYARAISFMMQQLRSRGRKKTSDSSIDLL
jgi:PPM family protein phosphatase